MHVVRHTYGGHAVTAVAWGGGGLCGKKPHVGTPAQPHLHIILLQNNLSSKEFPKK